jgi:hypothetical protein
MHNWSTDTSRLKKDPKKYEKFVLEQKINFGLQGQKLSSKSLKKNWSNLDIDPSKKSFLQKLLWPQS